MYEFKLPDVGEGIHEAEIVRWLVKQGDTVALDQPMLEVQTDKAIVEIPAPVAGVVSEIRVKPGIVAEVGDVLIVIDPQINNKNAPKPVSNGKTAKKIAVREDIPQAMSSVKKPGLAGPGKRVLAAPAVRKLALELEIDLAQVVGSGPSGRVLPSDVHAFAKRPPEIASVPTVTNPEMTSISSAPLSTTLRSSGEAVTDEEPLQGLRRRIAQRMEEAWKIPHVTTFEEVDVSKLVAFRQDLKAEVERRELKLTYLPFIIKAVVQTLKTYPYFNASLSMEQQKVMLHRFYHIGVATAIDAGLLVPVIRHADQLSPAQIASELARLSDAARQRKLSPSELSGSTFTITNFGSFGGSQGTPIINPPEVAILGVGRIQDKPVAIDGQLDIRPMLPLALSFDHRLLDGAAAGAFLTRVMTLLSDPKLLFLDMV